jgi:hypothetical protein
MIHVLKHDMHKNAPDSRFVADLRSEGYSERVIGKLWKWYAYSEKKGVAIY